MNNYNETGNIYFTGNGEGQNNRPRYVSPARSQVVEPNKPNNEQVNDNQPGPGSVIQTSNPPNQPAPIVPNITPKDNSKEEEKKFNPGINNYHRLFHQNKNQRQTYLKIKPQVGKKPQIHNGSGNSIKPKSRKKSKHSNDNGPMVTVDWNDEHNPLENIYRYKNKRGGAVQIEGQENGTLQENVSKNPCAVM